LQLSQFLPFSIPSECCLGVKDAHRKWDNWKVGITLFDDVVGVCDVLSLIVLGENGLAHVSYFASLSFFLFRYSVVSASLLLLTSNTIIVHFIFYITARFAPLTSSTSPLRPASPRFAPNNTASTLKLISSQPPLLVPGTHTIMQHNHCTENVIIPGEADGKALGVVRLGANGVFAGRLVLLVL
jgi:hypothetical protein